MKQDEAFNPIAVRLIGANAVVLDRDVRVHLIERARQAGRRLLMVANTPVNCVSLCRAARERRAMQPKRMDRGRRAIRRPNERG